MDIQEERKEDIELPMRMAKTNKTKAKHCEYVRGKSDQEIGFGAMINMLAGKL